MSFLRSFHLIFQMASLIDLELINSGRLTDPGLQSLHDDGFSPAPTYLHEVQLIDNNTYFKCF